MHPALPILIASGLAYAAMRRDGTEAPVPVDPGQPPLPPLPPEQSTPQPGYHGTRPPLQTQHLTPQPLMAVNTMPAFLAHVPAPGSVPAPVNHVGPPQLPAQRRLALPGPVEKPSSKPLASLLEQPLPVAVYAFRNRFQKGPVVQVEKGSGEIVAHIDSRNTGLLMLPQSYLGWPVRTVSS